MKAAKQVSWGEDEQGSETDAGRKTGEVERTLRGRVTALFALSQTTWLGVFFLYIASEPLRAGEA